MKLIAKIIALLSLGLLFIPPCLFLAGKIELAKNNMLLLIATIVWFIFATIWMWGGDKQPSS